jgi:hypothetical protein
VITDHFDQRDGLIALSAWLKQIGRSATTGWRWTKAGWLHPINIAGRPYLSADDIAQFVARARSGELARPPAGAARESSHARIARRGEEGGTVSKSEAV